MYQVTKFRFVEVFALSVIAAGAAAGSCLTVAALARDRPLAQMKGEHRVLIVSSASATDPLLAAQRRETRGWGSVARERDLVVVEAIGARVIGASDSADTLRRRYDLPTRGFGIALVGKYGRVAYRASHPIGRSALIAIIDAMPMRRAGLR